MHARQATRWTIAATARRRSAEIQRWIVIPALMSVPGVVNDTNFGGFITEYQLDLDPKQLEHFGLGITDTIAAINVGKESNPDTIEGIEFATSDI